MVDGRKCGPNGEHCSRCYYAEIFIASASNDWSIVCHAEPPQKDEGSYLKHDFPVFYGYGDMPQDQTIWCGKYKEKLNGY